MENDYTRNNALCYKNINVFIEIFCCLILAEVSFLLTGTGVTLTVTI